MNPEKVSNPLVDKFLVDGCMRCKYGATPRCKVNTWREELLLLRKILHASELKEEVKWSVPVYTLNGSNVVSISALKDSCVMSFFKGALLSDPHLILEQQGHIQAARIVRFTDTDKIQRLKTVLHDYISEAIKLAISGAIVPTVKNPEPMPAELIAALNADPALKKAFYALTPGRQRGYIIHFSQPMQSKTRIARIERNKEIILRGKGMHD